MRMREYVCAYVCTHACVNDSADYEIEILEAKYHFIWHFNSQFLRCYIHFTRKPFKCLDGKDSI